MKQFFVVAIPAIAVLFMSSARAITFGQQDPTPDPDITVARPAYVKSHPKVLFDEAHFNVHTSGDRSKAFADLITKDGYRVVPNKEKFEAKNLKGVDILVIVSALGANREINPEAAGNPAFTEDECDVVKDWVRGGGSLLLITDHEPTGAAARNLAKRFGVDMSDGTTKDSSPENYMKGCNGCMRFTRENGLLGDHAITRGRDSVERIRGIENGVGQSLKGPPGSISFLKLADTAYDELPGGKKISAAGRSQGIAFKFGKGRVVVLGEAAMLAGQGPRPGQKFRRWWLDYPGIDNRQLALNILHWLS
ncbi:MAG: hypothetical protein AABN95_09900, partial [Acidobacteriota bacterium]